MEYYALLQKISLTIYAHDRQQGLGTLYPLIFFGSKIVIKRNTSSYQYFNKKIRGLMPFEESFNVNFDPLSNSNLKHNQGFVKEELSPANIRKSWGL